MAAVVAPDHTVMSPIDAGFGASRTHLPITWRNPPAATKAAARRGVQHWGLTPLLHAG
jgi:hypothetical protein